MSETGEQAVVAGVGGRAILERMRLDGRVALVTGAGAGIGRAFAHALGEAGAGVVVADIDGALAERVASELDAKGIRSLSLAVDVTDDAAGDAMVDAAVEQLGGLHIAVNNAGVNRNAAAEEMSIEAWDAVFALNARAVFRCCQAQARVMLAQRYGKIVNTGSTAAQLVPHPQPQVAYNASKAAVVQLTRTLAGEWADRGVRVNCISPGIVRTALIEGSDVLRPLVAEWCARIPLGRLAEVTDLQAAIVFLAGEASDYMTGHDLVLDGGQTLW